MTTEGPKKRRDPPLRLGMDFEEALGRFIQTDPVELSDKVQAPPKAGRKRPAPEEPLPRATKKSRPKR